MPRNTGVTREYLVQTTLSGLPHSVDPHKTISTSRQEGVGIGTESVQTTVPTSADGRPVNTHLVAGQSEHDIIGVGRSAANTAYCVGGISSDGGGEGRLWDACTDICSPATRAKASTPALVATTTSSHFLCSVNPTGANDTALLAVCSSKCSSDSTRRCL